MGISESNSGQTFEILNTSNRNPNDFDFRGQLIRMETPLITEHNHVCFEVYFEKIPPKIEEIKPMKAKQQKVLIKGSLIEHISSNDGMVRVKIDNFERIISNDKENKSLIIELQQSEIMNDDEMGTDDDE